MLDSKLILSELGCKKEIINKLLELEKNKVVNLNPYNTNNTNIYVKEDLKDKIFKLPSFLKDIEKEYEFFIFNVENIFECLLSIFDEDYYQEQENNNKKFSNILRIRLLTDLDEKYKNISNKKNLRSMLDEKISISTDIFYYIKEYFGVSIYLIHESTKLIKQYVYQNNNNFVFIIEINNKFYPIIGKNLDNKNLTKFNNNNFNISEYDFFNQAKQLVDSKTSEINFKNLCLTDIQEKAKCLNIKIMKLNKKGDKEIKKTKNELIYEIELVN
jgi:hypothetical protein